LRKQNLIFVPEFGTTFSLPSDGFPWKTPRFSAFTVEDGFGQRNIAETAIERVASR